MSRLFLFVQALLVLTPRSDGDACEWDVCVDLRTGEPTHTLTHTHFVIFYLEGVVESTLFIIHEGMGAMM